MKKHLLILLFYSFCFNALSQSVINLKSGKIKFSDSSELNLLQENNYCFLTLKNIPTNEEKESMSLLGISFLEYIPRNTFLVNFPKGADFFLTLALVGFSENLVCHFVFHDSCMPPSHLIVAKFYVDEMLMNNYVGQV